MLVPGLQKRNLVAAAAAGWIGWYGRWLWAGWLFPFAPKTSESLICHRGSKHSSSLPLSHPSALPHRRRIPWFFALLGSHESVLPPHLTGGCWQPYLSVPWRLRMAIPAKPQMAPLQPLSSDIPSGIAPACVRALLSG